MSLTRTSSGLLSLDAFGSDTSGNYVVSAALPAKVKAEVESIKVRK